MEEDPQNDGPEFFVPGVEISLDLLEEFILNLPPAGILIFTNQDLTVIIDVYVKNKLSLEYTDEPQNTILVEFRDREEFIEIVFNAVYNILDYDTEYVIFNALGL